MPQPIPSSPIVRKLPGEEIGLVQGMMPDSINEWYVSLALDKLQLVYFYQFAMRGGDVRGGQVIDFLVQTARGWLPVYVNGDYWHSPKMDPELQLKLAEAAHEFGIEPIVLDEEETNTRQHALASVRKKVL